MSKLECILKEFERHTFTFLKMDGVFAKGTIVGDDKILLETTTYVTDTDDGRDIDCLCVYEDDLGLGGACVCEDITTGKWLQDYPEGQAPRGCVACPACERLTKPWKLQKRCYSLMVRIDGNQMKFLDSRPISTLKGMPDQMSGKIIDMCNASFPEWSHS